MATISLRVTIAMDEEQIRRYAEARELARAGADGAVSAMDLAVDLQRYVQERLRSAPAFPGGSASGHGAAIHGATIHSATVTVTLPHRDQYEQAEPTQQHRARRHRPA